MKKLLLLCLLISTFTSKAQTLVDSNNVWSITYENIMGPWQDTWTTFLRFQNDSTINGVDYKLLYASIDSMQNWYMQAPIREDSTQKVYFHNGTNDMLLYDFSLNANDSVITSNPSSSCEFYSVVDSVDTVTLYNGETRKRLFLSGGISSWGTLYNLVWIDGIGSTLGIAREAEGWCQTDTYLYLNCFFEDNILKYKNDPQDPCYMSSVGIENPHPAVTFSIKPNPFTEFTSIRFENLGNRNCNFNVYSIDGRSVHSQSIYENEVDFQKGNLSNGFYTFQVSVGNEILSTGKLMIQ